MVLSHTENPLIHCTDYKHPRRPLLDQRKHMRLNSQYSTASNILVPVKHHFRYAAYCQSAGLSGERKKTLATLMSSSEQPSLRHINRLMKKNATQSVAETTAVLPSAPPPPELLGEAPRRRRHHHGQHYITRTHSGSPASSLPRSAWGSANIVEKQSTGPFGHALLVQPRSFCSLYPSA